MKSITLLGATGSIGGSTLDIIARHPQLYSVHALTANTNAAQMATLCRQFHPAVAVMADAESAQLLRSLLEHQSTEVLSGQEALSAVASSE